MKWIFVALFFSLTGCTSDEGSEMSYGSRSKAYSHDGSNVQAEKSRFTISEKIAPPYTFSTLTKLRDDWTCSKSKKVCTYLGQKESLSFLMSEKSCMSLDINENSFYYDETTQSCILNFDNQTNRYDYQIIVEPILNLNQNFTKFIIHSEEENLSNISLEKDDIEGIYFFGLNRLVEGSFLETMKKNAISVSFISNNGCSITSKPFLFERNQSQRLVFGVWNQTQLLCPKENLDNNTSSQQSTKNADQMEVVQIIAATKTNSSQADSLGDETVYDESHYNIPVGDEEFYKSFEEKSVPVEPSDDTSYDDSPDLVADEPPPIDPFEKVPHIWKETCKSLLDGEICPDTKSTTTCRSGEISATDNNECLAINALKHSVCNLDNFIGVDLTAPYDIRCGFEKAWEEKCKTFEDVTCSEPPHPKHCNLDRFTMDGADSCNAKRALYRTICAEATEEEFINLDPEGVVCETLGKKQFDDVGDFFGTW